MTGFVFPGKETDHGERVLSPLGNTQLVPVRDRLHVVILEDPRRTAAAKLDKSMEPAIPDGSYCLFSAPVAGTREGKTVLVQLRDAVDPENGERYTVKRYHSEKIKDHDSWRHARITLKPLKPGFQRIELTGSEEDLLQVVAELVALIGS